MFFLTIVGINLAYNKATWQSQTAGVATSDMVVDGSVETCSTSNGSADNITWFVDLDAIHTVSEIELSLIPRDWNTGMHIILLFFYPVNYFIWLWISLIYPVTLYEKSSQYFRRQYF